ncbi:MAG: glucuronyl hydrolase [Ruminococcaceae bacterium]|nr:glucuronyl hydrolase [Oscillospiraceae bacterium]
MYRIVDLNNKERFAKPVILSKEKLESAAALAVARVEKAIDKFGADNMLTYAGGSFDTYTATKDVTWTTGMWTGVCWLAYELTGNDKFRQAAESQLPHYYRAAQHPEELNDHDTGFKFIPSCLAAYKITGNQDARMAGLIAAQVQLDHFCQVNKFIIRGGMGRPEEYNGYRTLVDSMMNIPLFFWAYEETGRQEFYDAAVGHYKTTAKYLIREDGSSFHHYQFDPVTKEPVRGLTFQGNRDESCWSRGHSWLLYGYPLAYKATKDPETIDIHKSVSYFFMDHLPSDGIPYWDFDFNDGSFEPRDSSAAAVATCGLLEMCKYLPETAEQKQYFRNAAAIMLEALIDKSATKREDKDSLLSYITIARPMGIGVDVCETYGDYFYLEALVRALKPEIKMFW